MQRLKRFTPDRSRTEEKSRSGRLGLSHCVSLQKIFVAERVEAVSAKESMHMSEGLQS